MKKAIAISIIATLAGVGTALAHGPDGDCGGRGPRGARHFDELDTNGDGKLTLDEMLKSANARFDAADANHDGQVTPEERKQARQKWADTRFTEQDANKDGALSANEMPPRFTRVIERADTNKDGKLSKAELDTFFQAKHSRFQNGKHAQETQQRDQLDERVTARFQKLDANKDGVLTPEEMRAGHHRFGHKHADQDEG